jgi:hypothetical protein
MENVLGYIVGVMENAIANVVAYWFVAQVLLTGTAVVVWLGWAFTRLVIKKPRVRGN